MTPFEAYQIYLAIRTHFTSPTYDFVKYGGKMKVNKQSLDKRRDKYFFYKLSKHQDPVGLLVSNYIATDNIPWIGKLVGSKDADMIYSDWVTRTQALQYNFKNDIVKLDDDFNSNFQVTEQYPPLLVLFNKNKVSIETMVILNKLLNYMPVWRKQITETTIFPVIDLKIIKYGSFIQFDKQKFKETLLDRFKDS